MSLPHRSYDQKMVDMDRAKRIRVARQILDDPTHPFFLELRAIVDLELDIRKFQDPPAARPATAEGSEHSTTPTPIGRNPR